MNTDFKECTPICLRRIAMQTILVVYIVQLGFRRWCWTWPEILRGRFRREPLSECCWRNRFEVLFSVLGLYLKQGSRCRSIFRNRRDHTQSSHARQNHVWQNDPEWGLTFRAIRSQSSWTKIFYIFSPFFGVMEGLNLGLEEQALHGTNGLLQDEQRYCKPSYTIDW